MTAPAVHPDTRWAESFASWQPLMIGVRDSATGALKAYASLATRQRAEGTAVVAMGNGGSLCTILPATDEAAADPLAGSIVRYLNDLAGAWSLDLEQLHELDRTMLILADRLDLPGVRRADEHRLAGVLARPSR